MAFNTKVHNSFNIPVAEKAILVGLIHKTQTEEKLNEYLNELEFLASTAGAEILNRFTQRLDRPEASTFIGSGKLIEIKEYIDRKKIDLVIFDDDLTPKQSNNLEKEFKIKVVDRSSLILDIFASRARTAQAKTQVELAQLQYLLPRLKGLWSHLERQQGGIGMRGPGEKEIETDRRIINMQISRLKADLQKIDKQSATQRKNRDELIRVALVGYTNVGKSTLMNLMSKSEVFAENKLFATLDTTVRKVVIERTPFLLSDTVGFIRKLPHNLIESFKSTLDEVREADILMHVVDLSHPQHEDHIKVVTKTLEEIGAKDKKILTVFNKIDRYKELEYDEWMPLDVKNDLFRELQRQWAKRLDGRCIFISAVTNDNMENLKEVLLLDVQESYRERYPYKKEFF